MHKLHNGLLAPDSETGASGAVETSTPNEGAQEVFAPNENNAPQETSPGESASTHEAQPPAQQPSSVTMTNEQLERLATTMVQARGAQQTPQPQQNQPITPEQQAAFDQAFNVVRVTPELYTSIFGVAPQSQEQLKALENVLHNVARMSNAMATYQFQQELQRREQALQGRFQPVADYVNQQQATKLENDFFTHAPDLKDFKGLVGEVIAAAKARGEHYNSPQEAFTKLATRVRDYLNKARGGTPPPNGQRVASRKTMPTTSMGGRTASVNGSQGAVSGPQAVFGDMDS